MSHFIYHREVVWGDMDSLGHLNNVRYYDYAQEARVRHMAQLLPAGFYTVIVATACQYRHEVKYPDTLQVKIWIEKVGTTSISHAIEFFSQSQNRLVATGQSTIVLMDKRTAQKCAIDDHLRAKLLEV